MTGIGTEPFIHHYFEIVIESTMFKGSVWPSGKLHLLKKNIYEEFNGGNHFLSKMYSVEMGAILK